MKLVLAAILTTLQLSTALAAPAEPVRDVVQAALISPIPENTLSANSSIDSDELEIIYDSTQVADVQVPAISVDVLVRESQAMKSSDYVNAQASTVVIPSSTALTEDLESLRGIKAGELSSFIARKNAYLEKIANVLTVVRLNPAAINRVLTLVNEQFFKRADAIMKANSQAASIGLGVGGGLGIPDWLTKQLRKSPLFKNMPEQAGFFFGCSLGIAIVHAQENGKSRLRFEPFVQFRHATKIIGPLAYVGGSIFAGVSVDQTSSLTTTHGNFFSISRIGFAWTDRGTSVGTSLIGASFPPLGSRFAVISGRLVEYRANREGFVQLGKFLNEFFGIKTFAQARTSQCQALFQRAGQASL